MDAYTKSEIAALLETLTTTLRSEIAAAINALHPIATSGNYNDLANTPPPNVVMTETEISEFIANGGEFSEGTTLDIISGLND